MQYWNLKYCRLVSEPKANIAQMQCWRLVRSKLKQMKTHIFIHTGRPRTLCGISDRDGIVFENIKKVTCKNCIKYAKEKVLPVERQKKHKR
jgi:hypothetical protein